VAAALAVALARRGKRVLIAMGGAHERLSATLRTPPIGHEPRELRPGIWASKIVPELAMEEYGGLVLRVRALTRLVFDSQITRSFFRAVPGLPEWAVLGKAWYLSTESRADGSARFDTVLFDAPSTGHALHMLQIPQVIMAVAPSGALRRDAEKAWQSFLDPTLTGVVVVGWPEDMATTETIELVRALRGRLKLPLSGLVLNGCLPSLFTAAQRGELLAQPELLPAPGQRWEGDASETVLAAAARHAAREEVQLHNRERLRVALGMPVLELPHLADGVSGPEAVERLADRL
jgi:anion-transporting  ArsA/GET3 family ATPase